MPRITISYRQADSADIAGRIYDRLVAHYGAGSVFMDINAIPLSVDYRSFIADALKESQFFLSLIVPRWLGSRDDGTSRIDDESDAVRIEIETALRSGLTIVPVL